MSEYDALLTAAAPSEYDALLSAVPAEPSEYDSLLEHADKPAEPRADFLPSVAAAAAQGTLNTAAAIADLPPSGVAIADKPLNPDDQERWNALVAERDDIENVEAHMAEGGGGTQNPRLLAIGRELAALSRPPVSETLPGKLRDAAGTAYEHYEVDPNAKNLSAQVGRGVGSFAANVPALAVNLPTAVLQMAGTTYEAAYGQKEKELRAAGETNETAIADQATSHAGEEAVKAVPQLAAYMAGGKLASGAVAKILPAASPLIKGVAGTVAGTGANVAVGAANRAIDGKPIVPDAEQLTQDVLFGIVHGYSEHGNAKREAQKPEVAVEEAVAKLEDARMPVTAEVLKKLDPAPQTEESAPTTPENANNRNLPVVDEETVNPPASATIESGEVLPTATPVQEPTPSLPPAEEPILQGNRQDVSRVEGEQVTSIPSTSNEGEKVNVDPPEFPPREIVPEPTAELSPSDNSIIPTPGGDQSPTSIRNAVVDQERIARGLQPAMEPAKRSFGSVWDEAMRQIDVDPDVPRNLVDELQRAPRPANDTENAILLHRQITLQNAYDAAARATVDAADTGDHSAAEENRVRAAALSDELQKIYDVGKQTGTENARGLNARKLAAASDYTLATMVTRKRAANGGKRLTPEAQKEVQEQHAAMQQARQAEESAVAAAEEKAATETAVNAVKEIVAKVKPVRAKTPRARAEAVQPTPRTASWIERQAQAARERIKERRKTTFADPLGVMTTIDLADRAIIGAADIASGLRDFAGWASKQLSEWGEAIGPHLQDLWDRSNALLAQHESVAEIADRMAERIKEGAALRDVRPYVRRMAEAVVRSGVTELDPLIDTLHPIVEEIVPGTTRRQTMDLFSGYGEFRQLSKDQIAVQLRELSGEAQQSAKIDDMLAGLAPKRTGTERRTPSNNERRLIKVVNELKKLGGFTVKDPETQLRSALQAQERALSNAIRDIATQIETGERPPASGARPTNERIEALRALLERLKDTREQVFGSRNREITDEQRLKLAVDAANRTAEEYERQVREEDFAKKKGRPTLTSPELEAAKARRDATKAELDELRELDETFIRQRVAKRQADLRDQIAELDRRLREGDLAPKGTPNRGEPSVTAEALASERDAMRQKLVELHREASRPVLTDAEKEAAIQRRALAAFKTRIAKRQAELAAKLAAGDFSPKPPRRTLTLDQEALKAKADFERVKNEYERGLIKDRLAKRDGWERALDGASKWRRAFVLSGVHTLAKLTSAASEIIGIAPVEEAVGGALGKLPGVRDVAEKAPRHGGFSVAAEVEAIAANVTKLFSDVGTYMSKGGTDLDAVYGEPHLYPFEWKEMVGRLHGALKTPARRNEWTRSFRKRMEFAGRKGVDITDPLVQTKIAMDAYKDANRSIFMESNMVVDAYKRALSRFGQVDKSTGKPTLGGKTAETVAKVLLPVVRIPTNVVARTFEYTFGTISGSARLAKALRGGVDNLPPEQADLIMRNLKRGSLGAAVLLIGFFNPQNVGGYYQGKRDDKDVKSGALRIFGHEIPKFLIHNPLLEQLQIGATVRRVMDSKLKKSDPHSQGLWAGIWAGALGLLEETPFVSQMLQTTKVFSPAERSAYFGELAKSLVVPQGVQEAAAFSDRLGRNGALGEALTGDTPRREAHGVIEHVETGIPGLRQQVPLKKKKP